jgi:hypothetical protein
MKVFLLFLTWAPLNDHGGKGESDCGRKKSGCFGKCGIRQLLGFYQFQQSISEKKPIIPIVKPMLKLIQIDVQMLHRKLVVGCRSPRA